MKMLIGHYAHESNGLRLEVEPETEHERQLLRAFRTYGAIQRDNYGDTLLIQVFKQPTEAAGGNDD